VQRFAGDRDDAADVPLHNVPQIVATKLLSRSRNGENRLDVNRIATGCRARFKCQSTGKRAEQRMQSGRCVFREQEKEKVPYETLSLELSFSFRKVLIGECKKGRTWREEIFPSL